MKHEIATNPEQSQHLIACGVDPKSADMVWMDDKPNNPRLALRTEIIEDGNPYIVTVAWSLSALLAMFPKEIYDKSDDMYYFSLAKEMAASDDYRAAYKPCWSEGEDLIYKCSPSPIEACVQMIEWLVENGYKLNGVE